MSRWSQDPEGSAAALIDGALDALALEGAVLSADGSDRLARALETRGLAVTAWGRRIGPGGAGAEVAPWPPAGPFDAALLRLPKSRSELTMALHALAGRLRPGGRLVLYGGNDEGIKSAARTLSWFCDGADTVVARGHGRVVAARRPTANAPEIGSLASFREQATLAIDGTLRAWVIYPGLFADGALDDGTALLLANLPDLPRGARCLDYGCGAGIVAAHLVARDPKVRVDMLDSDSVALLAAAENVPGAATILAARLQGSRRYDAILSNPPLHAGVAEDHAALDALITDAPRHLAVGGVLVLAVQRRIPLERALAGRFRTVATSADDGRYRVWLART